MSAPNEFEQYLQYEWNQFQADPARARATVEAVSGVAVRRVLDIGCGAGQEMLPLVSRGAFGVGLDYNPAAGVVGTRQYGRGQAAFLGGSGEYLPFRDGTFDVLICRLAIPYMDNRQALHEMARVLRPGGRLLLKIHAAGYYVKKCWTGIRTVDPKFSIHALRVLTAGTLYHLTGRQQKQGLWTKEVFQSRPLLERELKDAGMSIIGTLPDSNRLTPSFVIAKA